MNLDKVFEEGYAVIISVDGTSSIQSYDDINQYISRDMLKIGSELSTPHSYFSSKLLNILVSDDTRTVFLAFTDNY